MPWRGCRQNLRCTGYLYIYKVETAAQKKMFHGADYVFMADMWNPKHLSDSRHLWVPISWENGAPVLKK